MPSALDPTRSEMDYSALDIAIEDAASGVGLPFLPGPPPPPLRAPKLVGVAILDRRLRYRRIDASLAAVNGLTPEEHLGKTLAEVRPDLAETISPVQRRVMETGEPLLSVPVEGSVRTAPSGRRWLASYFPLPPSAESLKVGREGPAGVVVVVREVDEELVDRPRGVSDERFRELVTQTTVGLAQVDREGTFLYVNDRFCEMTGWARHELVGVRTQQEITHPHDAGRNEVKFSRALKTGEPYLSDKRYRRPDGRSVWVRNTTTVLPGPDGQAESLFAVAVDMTDRVRTQRALSRSESRLRLATEAGGMGVWAFDLKRGTADWSSEALEIYGGGFDGKPTREELQARVHPDDRARVEQAEPRPADGGPARVDVTYRVVHPPRPGRAEGEIRWVRALGEQWFDEFDRPLRSVGVLRDVTTEHVAADKLAQSERRLRLAVDAADLGIWEYDVAADSCDWDERTAELFGLSAEYRAGQRQFTAEEMLAAVHPDDRDRIAAAFAASLDPAGAGKYDVEHRVVHPDGAVRVLAVSGEASFVGSGASGSPDARRVLRVTGTAKDVTERRARARRLADSERRQRLALDAAETGTFEYDPATGLMEWDARTRRFFGVDGPEYGGRTQFVVGSDGGEMLTLTHPDDQDAMRAALAACFDPDGDGRYDLTHRVVHPDASVRWLRAQGETRFEGVGPDRRAVQTSGTVRDVTAERRREARLAETEQRRRFAAEAADLGAFDFDLRRGRLWWDDRCRTIFGSSAGEVADVNAAFDRIHLDDVTRVRAAVEAACAPTGSPRYQVEYRVVHSDGAVRWVRANGESRFETPGEPAARLLGCVRDVTEDREREERLRLSEERQRLAAAASELGSFTRDLRTGEVWWDERSRELFGMSGETVSSDATLARLHPDDHERLRARVDAAVNRTAPARFRVEYRLPQPDGTDRWIRSQSEVQFDGPEGPAVRVIGYLQDVTAEKRYAAALEEAKARLEQANDRLEREVARRTAQLRTAAERLAEAGRQERDRIAHVLHDHLQQILVGAKMNLSALTMTSEGPARELSERVSELIDEAIGESRSLSAELSPPILRSAGLGPALGWLAEQFRSRHGLEVKVETDADASAALDDSLAALLFGAAREGLLNAAKHAEAKSVRLKFERCVCGPDCGLPGAARGDCSGVRLTVADDGIGFDTAAEDGESSESPTGFGMSDLRQRVDLLGGVVNVASAPGAGCTVEVCVPLTSAGAAAEPHALI
ncbi:PAS domain-containing protein [Alienimonas sp. DA493]|uniref:PAS domain-containing protein n=1 Tax=Alienimonas sp. DA493 TaxID=3373605 RepID=UPI00375480AE